jgi:Uma2 family endonuclease
MSTARHFQPISVSDYLAGESQAKRKHEYVDGVIYAMAGGTVTHSRIASNVMVALGGQLRGQRCQVFNSDIKVRVQRPGDTRFYYPDVSVVCQPNPPDDLYHDRPVVIVEVISESTRRIDEYEKREAYLSIDTLQAYLLIEPAAAAVLVYRRRAERFERETYEGRSAIIELPEVGCRLTLADLYENVEFDLRASDGEDR